MQNIKLNELTLDNLAIWPLPIKAGVIIICCLLVLGLGYWFDLRSMALQLTNAQQHENDLRIEFETKTAQAGNLAGYRQQLQQMQNILASMIKQLPDKTEIPNLLEDISKIGLNNGLHFQLFKPLPEQDQGFFIELPIQMSVLGNYHQLGQFISQIAGLNRIVSLQDFSIEPNKNNSNALQNATAAPEEERLIMHVIAKTYRYPETVTNKK